MELLIIHFMFSICYIDNIPLFLLWRYLYLGSNFGVILFHSLVSFLPRAWIIFLSFFFLFYFGFSSDLKLGMASQLEWWPLFQWVFSILWIITWHIMMGSLLHTSCQSSSCVCVWIPVMVSSLVIYLLSLFVPLPTTMFLAMGLQQFCISCLWLQNLECFCSIS